MAVSTEYLNKVRFAVRRSSSANVDSEITDLIEECRADLISKGVPQTAAEDESNYLVLGCMRSFVRWKFGLGDEEAEQNRNDYRLQADELRKQDFDEEESNGE